jgi:uncharacterized protein
MWAQKLSLSLAFSILLGGLSTAQFVRAEVKAPSLERVVEEIETGNLRKGVRALYRLAKTGDVDAQYMLGVLYDEGRGVRKSDEAAAYWFTMAAEAGNSAAQYEMGLRFDKGNGVQSNWVEAGKWYEKAATSGDKEAEYNLISLKREVDRKMRTTYTKNTELKESPNAGAPIVAKLAADVEVVEMERNGNWVRVNVLSPDAEKNNGWVLDTQLAPVGDAEGKGKAAYASGNYTEAFLLWKPLATSGHVPSMFNLGQMLEHGKGVKKDLKQAAHWYRLAARRGNTPAQSRLGHFYLKGNGVGQDKITAYKMLKKAAEAGSAESQLTLADMYADGNGIPQDDATAVHWYQRAAKRGSIAAQARLSKMYVEGRGVRQSSPEAYAWATLAALQGDKNGKILLAELEQNLPNWQLEKGRKLSRQYFSTYVN